MILLFIDKVKTAIKTRAIDFFFVHFMWLILGKDRLRIIVYVQENVKDFDEI